MRVELYGCYRGRVFDCKPVVFKLYKEVFTNFYLLNSLVERFLGILIHCLASEYYTLNVCSRLKKRLNFYVRLCVFA